MEADAKKYRKHIVFTVAGEKYIADLEQVREVLDVPDITFVPGAVDVVMGVVNVRGLITTIVDGVMLLNGDSHFNKTDESKIVIFESSVLNSSIGISVDSVDSVVPVDVGQLERVLKDEKSGSASLVYHYEDEVYIVFDEKERLSGVENAEFN